MKRKRQAKRSSEKYEFEQKSEKGENKEWKGTKRGKVRQKHTKGKKQGKRCGEEKLVHRKTMTKKEKGKEERSKGATIEK